jgi:hypothetical protein
MSSGSHFVEKYLQSELEVTHEHDTKPCYPVSLTYAVFIWWGNASSRVRILWYDKWCKQISPPPLPALRLTQADVTVKTNTSPQGKLFSLCEGVGGGHTQNILSKEATRWPGASGDVWLLGRKLIPIKVGNVSCPAVQNGFVSFAAICIFKA